MAAMIYGACAALTMSTIIGYLYYNRRNQIADSKKTGSRRYKKKAERAKENVDRLPHMVDMKNIIREAQSAFKKDKSVNIKKVKAVIGHFNAATPKQKEEMVEYGVIKQLCELLEETQEKEPSFVSKSSGFRFSIPWISRRRDPQPGSGTGYTSPFAIFTGTAWSMKKAERKTREYEEKLEVLIRALTAFIYCTDPDYSEKRSIEDSSYINENVVEQIRDTGILSLMDQYLMNDSILIVSSRISFFEALIELAAAMSTVPSLLVLLVDSRDSQSLAKMSIPNFAESMKKYTELFCDQVEDDVDTVQFIQRLQDCNKTIQAAVLKSEKRPRGRPAKSRIDTPKPVRAKEDGLSGEALDQKYKEVMKEHQIQQWKLIDDDGKFLTPFSFEKDVKNTDPMASTMRTRTKRIAKELASMLTSLPLNASNSIFIAVDESRCDVIKALISGPDDTPYANGLFEFDIFFPNSYPDSPPKVRFLTTNQGKFRFNPNLYADGKVCLSLLGTWVGFSNEKWTPRSSLLQVLISLQSMVLVREPWFNEPGYAHSANTEKGQTNSKTYNVNTALATLFYGIDAYRNAPFYFKDIYYKHVCMKKHAIVKQANLWLEASVNYKNYSKGQLDSVRKIIREVSALPSLY